MSATNPESSNPESSNPESFQGNWFGYFYFCNLFVDKQTHFCEKKSGFVDSGLVTSDEQDDAMFFWVYLSIHIFFQTKFQQSQSYLLPHHSTLQNQQNPDRAAIFGGPKTTQNQDYSRFVLCFFHYKIENPDLYYKIFFLQNIVNFRSECFKNSTAICFFWIGILEDSYDVLSTKSYGRRILDFQIYLYLLQLAHLRNSKLSFELPDI